MAAAPERPDAPPPARRTGTRPTNAFWRYLRLALLVGWLLLGVAVVARGERTSSFHELEARVASGDVHDVTLVGNGLTSAGRASVPVEVRWRDGLFHHTATVVETRPRRAAPNRAHRDPDSTVITGTVEERLAASQPGLRFHRGDYPGVTSSYLGLRLPAWAGSAGLGLLLGALLVLMAGPSPWRATRWAWFWLLGLASPLGVIAFLLLSGPLRRTPVAAPRDPARRLTGGWAFLLVVAVSGAVSSVLRAT
ncbi:MAG: hypothetical protein JWO76_48 [Nocardioides sp.]|nr:hypothetical protein [Nocardioides sp.]